jgi:hypothetical protein
MAKLKFNDGVFRNDLACSARRMEYDFETRTGFLHLGVMNCTDMRGCLRLFQSIDPRVRVIYTFSASCEDTAYYRKEGTDLWRAVVGGRFNMHRQVDVDDQLELGDPRISEWRSFPPPPEPLPLPPWALPQQG